MDLGIIAADDRSAPFFEAAARDVLLIKRCAGCDRWLDPGATGCPGCGAADPRWEQAAGRGCLVSWAVLPAGKPGPAGPPDDFETPGRPGFAMRPACSPWWNSTRGRGCGPGWRAGGRAPAELGPRAGATG